MHVSTHIGDTTVSQSDTSQAVSDLKAVASQLDRGTVSQTLLEEEQELLSGFRGQM